MTDSLRQAALDYHALPTPGKLSVELTTPAETQEDLSLAYSPGVAEPVREIAKDPEAAYRYTGKGNLVAVISNGSAILGLGNLGPLASKPVMEGKSLLFKRFADINSVDIEVEAPSPERFIETVAAIANTFGGINLEDIKAPECFHIEEALIQRCSVPIFHDDQHGTAIVTVAGMLNALEIQGKNIEDARIVCLGAGAAATACCKLLLCAGAKKEQITMLDSRGVIHSGRSDINAYKGEWARDTEMRTLDDAIEGADVFLGVSGPDLLSAGQLAHMADKPVVFACSNPNPEIAPELAHATRDDLIMATGRSDYPNQVNNVLCFPFIFRGALDVRATSINEHMKLAAIEAIRKLAREEVPQEVRAGYGGVEMAFGPSYILPKPTDPRLLPEVAAAVAKAAVDSGAARLPYPEHYPLKPV
ncbi:malic enzyme-like NAD(P)-binding protein [Microbulbifer agarilyticus]|uniref:malic enzyme-like NAD(P)-binding protein n=1 Tax=Microbulbifer agarilyticus TaxID=260552 RepID=UPI001CD2B4A5|nr:malic enzyme-like NAD(P)-binding protein [Microbulbifer agarilyticus]MCA0893398.1 malate dehydrogenase [Microbulbifer agarilyticus]